ncbi:type II toxin-antitoxin system PemK/MazF family toxin [Lentilactobacillus hilgardii]|uniref:type II toxin-antitoxin system PemK/MazF family toxin n=1 Tax=Lentilactobacillus hilgardii TaxID=1588 RepID=UPI003FA55AEE
MAKKSQKTNNYVPNQQDIIFIDFDPSIGHEIRKRRPALVLSNQGYSRLTNLVVVSAITHANNNALRKSGFLVRVMNKNIDGFVNPLQFYTYDFDNRNAEYVGLLDTPSFIKVKQTIIDILN